MGRTCTLFDSDAEPGFCGGRKRGSGREPSSPGDYTCAGQYGPPVSFPTADSLLVQQAFQLVRLAMSQWLERVSWAPVPQHERLAKSVVIQNRPVGASFLRLFGPVNHCEAKSSCQTRHGEDSLSAREFDRMLEFSTAGFWSPTRRRWRFSASVCLKE